MTDKILLLTGSALTAVWGIAHLFPTKDNNNGMDY